MSWGKLEVVDITKNRQEKNISNKEKLNTIKEISL